MQAYQTIGPAAHFACSSCGLRFMTASGSKFAARPHGMPTPSAAILHNQTVKTGKKGRTAVTMGERRFLAENSHPC